MQGKIALSLSLSLLLFFFLGGELVLVLRWIKNAHKLLQELLEDFNPLVSEKADIIELNIYLCKKEKVLAWKKLIFEDNF